MEIGGNIELLGFNTLDNPELVVIKKIVGQFVKIITTEYGEVERFVVEQSLASTGLNIDVALTLNGEVIEETASDDNLFYALAKALNNLQSKL